MLECHNKVTQLHESARFGRPVEIKKIIEEEATEKGDEEERDILSAKIIIIFFISILQTSESLTTF